MKKFLFATAAIAALTAGSALPASAAQWFLIVDTWKAVPPFTATPNWVPNTGSEMYGPYSTQTTCETVRTTTNGFGIPESGNVTAVVFRTSFCLLIV